MPLFLPFLRLHFEHAQNIFLKFRKTILRNFFEFKIDIVMYGKEQNDGADYRNKAHQ